MPFTDLDTVTITGTWLTFKNVPATGNVTFTTSPALQALVDSSANQIVIPVKLGATLDGSGHISVVVPATDDPDLTPSGFTYVVTETITDATGGPRVYEITVPLASAGGTLDLADVSPVVSLPTISAYALLADFLALEARVEVLELAGLGVTGERLFSKAGTAVVAAGISRWYAPENVTVTNVITSAGLAPTGTVPLICDVKKNGTTLFTSGVNRPSIAPGTNADLSSVPAVTFVAQGDYLTADIVQVGDSFPGSDVNIQIEIL